MDENMKWDEIVESMGWTVETEYQLAMEFIWKNHLGDDYRDFLAKKASEEKKGK